MVGDVEALLRQLWNLNDKDDIRQAREEAPASASEIPTCDPATTLAMSPMLRARYAFADAWHGAAFGQTWPGLREIATISARLRERPWHDAHMKAMARALPEGADPGRVVVLGIDEAKGQATYLVAQGDDVEPVVCTFYGGGRNLFRDLGRYLEFLVGERVHDDSLEILIPPGQHAAGQSTAIAPA